MCPPALELLLPAPVDWGVKLPRFVMRSDSSFSSRGKEEMFRGRREKGGEVARGWEEDGGFLVCWGPFARACWWQPDREGEGGRAGGARTVSHNAPPVPLAKRSESMSAICAHRRQNKRFRHPFGICSICCPTIPCSAGKRAASRAPQNSWGLARRHYRKCASGMFWTGSLAHHRLPAIFFVFDPYPPGRASLRAHTIHTRYINIYMSLQRADAERRPVSNRPRIAHMCGCCARGTGSGEISNRSASPKYQPVPWLQ